MRPIQIQINEQTQTSKNNQRQRHTKKNYLNHWEIDRNGIDVDPHFAC